MYNNPHPPQATVLTTVLECKKKGATRAAKTRCHQAPAFHACVRLSLSLSADVSVYRPSKPRNPKTAASSTVNEVGPINAGETPAQPISEFCTTRRPTDGDYKEKDRYLLQKDEQK